MTKKSLFPAFIFCLFVFNGCMGHVALTEEKRASIRSVRINEEVPIEFPIGSGYGNLKCDFVELNQKVLDDLGIEKYLVPLPQSCPPLQRFQGNFLRKYADRSDIDSIWPVELHPHILYVACTGGNLATLERYPYNFQDPVLGVIFCGNTIWMVKADNDAQIIHYWTETPQPLKFRPILEFIQKKQNFNIDNYVGQILREKFIDELQNSQMFNITTSENADAEFHLKIKVLSTLMWAYKRKPVMGVTGTLSKRDGQILWQKYEVLSHLDERTPEIKGPGTIELLNNPKLIHDLAAVASKFVAKDLVKDLNK